MSVRPVYLKDLRKTAVSQHQLSKGTGNYNRWSPLVPRDRSVSVGKRRLSDKDEDNPSQGNTAKNPRFDSSVVLDQLKGQETLLLEVKEGLGKINYDVVIGQVLPQPVKDVIVGLGNAVNMLLKSQQNLTSVLVDVVKVKETEGRTPVATARGPGEVKVKAKPTPVPADPKVLGEKKVRQAIREAEKKTLIFNLDMGKVPVMNKDTLSRKVTLALGEKASSGDHDYDIKDAEDAIDDILSCSKLEFLGATSKKFYNKRNPNDVRNDTFCTLPVRFEFRDRETRIQAEKTLRKVCHVSCATPYPKRLRTMLDTLLTEGKKKYPNSFIKTKVSVDDLTIEAHAKVGDKWVDLGLKCSIPHDICDQVTTELQVSNSQPCPTQDEVMQVS
jgi:hypothetical protein